MQPFAEPDDPAEAIDHPEPVAGWHSDQKATVIRPEIDRGKAAADPLLAAESVPIGLLNRDSCHNLALPTF
jgi:hypothetical protein